MEACVLYDGKEFEDSAKAIVAHFKAKGFSAVRTSASFSGMNASALPREGCFDVSMWLSHGGWDGPLMFNTTLSQVDPVETPGEWNCLKDGLDRHINPGGMLVVHACHSGGSNRYESTLGAKGERWVQQVARDMNIYTAGVEGETASANRQWAIQFLDFALSGRRNRQPSRAYAPGGIPQKSWRGWLNTR